MVGCSVTTGFARKVMDMTNEKEHKNEKNQAQETHKKDGEIFLSKEGQDVVETQEAASNDGEGLAEIWMQDGLTTKWVDRSKLDEFKEFHESLDRITEASVETDETFMRNYRDVIVFQPDPHDDILWSQPLTIPDNGTMKVIRVCEKDLTSYYLGNLDYSELAARNHIVEDCCGCSSEVPLRDFVQNYLRIYSLFPVVNGK